MMAEEAATRNVDITCVAVGDAASCKHLRVTALKIVFCKHRAVSPIKEAISLLQYRRNKCISIPISLCTLRQNQKRVEGRQQRGKMCLHFQHAKSLNIAVSLGLWSSLCILAEGQTPLVCLSMLDWGGNISVRHLPTVSLSKFLLLAWGLVCHSNMIPKAAGLMRASWLSSTSFQCVLIGYGDRGEGLATTLLRAECYQRSSLLMALACVREAPWVSSKP